MRKALLVVGFVFALGCVAVIAESLLLPTRDCPYCKGTAVLSRTDENTAYRFDYYSCPCSGVCWDRVDKSSGHVEHWPNYSR